MRRLNERLDRWLNPILVKELQQGMRRRELAVGSLLGLLAPVAAYLVMIADASTGSESFEREGYAAVVVAMVMGMAWFVIPIGGGQQLHGELRSQTLELLALTRLSPWELVSGRFVAALVKLALVLAFAGPFMVVGILMGGLDLEEIVELVVYALAGCALLSSLSLLAVTPLVTAPGLGRLVIVGAVMALISAASLFGTVVGMSGSAGSSYAATLWIGAVTLTSTLFFLRLTADVFLPPGRRSYRWSKLALIPALAAITLPLWTGTSLWFGGTDPWRMVVLFCCIAFAYVFLTLWSASPSHDARSAWRALWPLGDGVEPALAYAALLTLPLCGLAVLNDVAWRYPALCLGQFALFTGTATLLHGALPHNRRTVEGYLLLLVALGMANLLATSVAAVQEGVHHPIGPTLSAFLPLHLFSQPRLITHPHWVYALPGVLGVAAMGFARLRRARASRHG